LQVVLSRAQSEGVGATVRRSIGNAELRNHDPFLMLDEFQLNSKPGAPTGFPDHPHRGAQRSRWAWHRRVLQQRHQRTHKCCANSISVRCIA
jgi:redox-sensitive bicupin YhaK (pirin superfamily)